MILSDSAIGQVNVMTTQNRGLTPEEYAEMCMRRIINVSQTAHPALREQAESYSRDIQRVVGEYMKKAVRSDRTTIYNALVEAGHPELAKSIMEI